MGSDDGSAGGAARTGMMGGRGLPRRLRGARGRLLARRTAALALAGLAAALLAADALGAGDGARPVVVAARAVPAGAELAAADLAVARVPDELVPDGAHAEPAALEGRTAAGPLGAGEPVTETRVLGPALAAKLGAGPNARIVAVAPRDAGLTRVLTVGDAVDVIAAAGDVPGADPAPATGAGPGPAEPPPGAAPSEPAIGQAGPGAVVAAGARVLATDDEGVVLLALPAVQAARVASVSLDRPLTLVLSGTGPGDAPGHP